MTLSLRTYDRKIAELTIEADSAKITTDLAQYDARIGAWIVNDKIIEGLIESANVASRFNGVSDVDFVYQIFCSLLSEYERNEFMTRITPQTNPTQQ